MSSKFPIVLTMTIIMLLWHSTTITKPMGVSYQGKTISVTRMDTLRTDTVSLYYIFPPGILIVLSQLERMKAYWRNWKL